MRKFTLLLIAVFGAFLISNAQSNVNVTFKVDLNAVTDLHEGGSVWIYMDAGWSEYYDMTDADSDGIYEYTMSLESGSTFTYRFSYQNGADPNSNYVEESVPDDCANDDGFREMIIPDSESTLDVVAFGSCTATPNTKVSVTFKVDMSHVESATDVQVVIKDPWIWTPLTDNGDGTWSASVELNAEGTYPYTFVNGGKDNWDEEESVPADCNMGTAKAPERHVVVGTEDLILDLVAFGSCDENPMVGNVVVTLSVDMNNVTDMYQASPTVWTYMDADWNEYYEMSDTDDDGIFSLMLDRQENSTMTYRFAYQNGPDPWTNYMEENVPTECANDDGFREYALTTENVDLDAVAFGSCDADAPAKVMLTFSVDMSLEESASDVQVVIKNPWIWTAMTDEGDGIWTATVEVDADNTYPYTFVNGGQDNWDGEEKIDGDCNFGTETAPERHVVVEESDVTTDLVYFGKCDHETSIESDQAVWSIYPNPAYSVVNIVSGNDEIMSVQIFDMSGKLILTQSHINTTTVNLDINNIENGIYLIQVNGLKSTNLSKLIVK